MLETLFVNEEHVLEGHRICGTCGTTKEVGAFYKDGCDRDGNPKYRRDCKICYNNTRIKSKISQSTPIPRPRKGHK